MAEETPIESIDLSKDSVPLLPLRDVVVFPHTVMPLFIGRKSSVNAIVKAMAANKYIFLVTQKDEKIEEPKNDDLYRVGTLATILQMLKLPDGTIKVLVEGVKRAKIETFIESGELTEVSIEEYSLAIDEDKEIEAMMRIALDDFERYIKLNKKYLKKFLKFFKK